MAPLAVALCLVLVMTLGARRIAPCSAAQRPVGSRHWMPPGRRLLDAGQAASAKYGDDAGAVLADLIADQVRA